MGSDYSWLRCWHPAPATPADRDTVLETAAGALRSAGYTEGEGRGLVAGLDGPWVQLGDQARSTECQGDYGPDADVAVTAAVSYLAPTVSFTMSDSAVFQVELWHAGTVVDRHGTMHFRWELFGDEEVDAWRGDPTAWEALLAPGARPEDLAVAWELKRENSGWTGGAASHVSGATARALGWDLGLAACGWSHDDEGLYMPWDDFFEPEEQEQYQLRALTLAPPAASDT